ncbi:MAG: M23 family metallopeptidase [Flavipsychrobacter sp.]|nr:M23 family metallopeptidase [Flavipsychrobacter sp.]
MLTYTIIGVTLLLAAWSIVLLVRGVRKPLKYSWHRVFFSASLALLMYLYGAWVYVSIHCKFGFGILYLLVLVWSLLRRRPIRRRHEKWRVRVNVAGGVLLATLCVLYFTGTTGYTERIALAFPLKKGKYFVLQGGKGLPANMFHYSYRGAVYAIDIVKLNRYGNRANSIFSDNLEDYEIYGDTIYSPCAGKVIQVRDENPDNTPPVRQRGPTNLNSVVVETDSCYVFLGHNKKGSALVREGDVVRVGQPLALVGNSGFSLEPHLHIQVHKKSGTGLPWYREPQLFIEFDGRAYLLFEVIRPKRVHMVED